jgi:hypothetical protein
MGRLFPSIIHHQKTLGVYLGLDLVETVSIAQTARDRSKNDYYFEKRRIEANTTQVQGLIDDAKQQFEEIVARLERIDSGQSVLTDPQYVAEINGKVSQYAREVAELQSEMQRMDQTYRLVQRDRDEAEQARQAIKETIAFKIVLNTLEVDRCPRCESAIEPMRLQDELDTRTCRVCRNPLIPTSTTETQESLLQAIEERITLLTRELTKSSRRLKKLASQVAEREQILNKVRAEFVDLSRQAQAGFTSEMRDLLRQKGFLEGRLAELQAQTEENQAERLRSLRVKMIVLRIAHKRLEAAMTKVYEETCQQLLLATSQMAREFGVANLRQLRFDDRFELFVQQGDAQERFEQLNVSEKLRVKLSFHLSLLSLRVRQRIGRHPLLLIIDSPASKDMDFTRFSALIKGLADIQERLGGDVQVLIASASEELAAAATLDNIDQRESGEKMF